jgi:hypothetical protein
MNEDKKESSGTLAFERFTQGDSADGTETTVSATQINSSRFLHIYLGGMKKGDATSVSVMYRKLPSGQEVKLGDAQTTNGGYELTVTHYVLESRAEYELRAESARIRIATIA